MNKAGKIYVAGHKGMVGSALVRLLETQGFKNLITATSSQLDLCNQEQVAQFFKQHKPQYVFLAAAKVGGIHANNSYKGQFLYENIMIQSNVMHQAHLNGVEKLLFLGSSCIYPKNAPQPISENELLTGLLEPTNQPYALAKIAGIEMCSAYRHQYGSNFISAMPTNLYGPNDNYDLSTSHVLPALIHKFHLAKIANTSSVEVWGSGTPRREFLHVDDLARACLFLMEHYNDPSPVNVGWGKDISIGELAVLINEITGANTQIQFNTSMPDGTPRKVLNTDKINKLGWYPSIPLDQGIRAVYELYAQSTEA